MVAANTTVVEQPLLTNPVAFRHLVSVLFPSSVPHSSFTQVSGYMVPTLTHMVAHTDSTTGQEDATEPLQQLQQLQLQQQA